MEAKTSTGQLGACGYSKLKARRLGIRPIKASTVRGSWAVSSNTTGHRLEGFPRRVLSCLTVGATSNLSTC